MIVKFAVFKLSDSVSGISNEGIEYDEYIFSLAYPKLFDSEEEAIDYIESELSDCEKRNIKNVRFIINEVYFLKDDKIFSKL